MTATATTPRTPQVRRAVAAGAPEPTPIAGPGWVETLLVALAVAVVGAAFGSLFADDTVAIELAAAASLPVLVAAGLRARRWSLGRAAAVSIVALLAFIVFVVLVDSLEGGLVPSGETLDVLGDGLIRGWADLLDSLLPLGDAPEPRVFLVALCWLAGLVTGELAARTRLVAHPMIPAVVLAVVLVLLHQPLGRPSALAGGVVTAAILLIPLVRATPERVLGDRGPTASGQLSSFHGSGGLGRRLVVGVPVAVVALALGAVGAQVLRFGTEDDPFDPRELRGESITTADVLNPLTQLKSVILQDPEVPAMTVTFLDPADALEVARVPLVRLDAYDGAVWTSTSRYERTNGDLGDPGITAAVAPTASAGIVLAEPTGPWLPAPGATTRVDTSDDLLVDPATGNLLPLTRGGIDAYRVESVVALPTAAEEQAAVPASGEDEAQFLALDAPLPPELATALDEAIQGTNGTWEQLEAIEAWLTANVAYDLSSPAGHSSARLADLVAGSRRGYSEQLASAFTLMARSLGVPARLVVGYRVAEPGEDGTPVPVEEVTSADFHAWSEVHLDGLGWVAFDPSPLAAGEAPVEPLPPEQGPGTTVTEGQVVGQTGAGPQETGPTETETPETSEGFSGILRLVGIILALAGLLVLLAVLAVLVAKRRRRNRRRDADAASDRLLGAWDEVQDRLLEAGLEIRPSMTVGEIAEGASTSLSLATAGPVLALVPYVRRTLYAADPPNDAMAAQAWARVHELEDGLRTEQGRFRTVRSRLDPRPLRRR